MHNQNHKLVQRHQVKKCGVTHRHEMYPGYKGQRPPTPEPITEAVKQLRDLIRVMGIPEIIVPGIEADDVIGTVAVRALKEGLQVVIASPDKVSVLFCVPQALPGCEALARLAQGILY